MDKKVRFIINPNSGTRDKKNIVSLIESIVSKNKLSYEICYTSYKGHLSELTIEAVNKNYFAVVVVGGDGSVNEAAKELVGTNTALGIIPAGSGNGLARHLKIPLNHKNAIEHILLSSIKKIDTAILNDIFFAGVAGIGFESLVGWKFADSKKRGFFTYAKIVLKEYFFYKPINVSIIADQEIVETKAFFVSIANSSQYGNNAYISPLSKINDGWLEVVIVKQLKWYLIPCFVYRLFNKSLDKFSEIKILHAKQIKIEQSSTFAHVDGEPIEPGSAIQISIVPNSLNVIY